MAEPMSECHLRQSGRGRNWRATMNKTALNRTADLQVRSVDYAESTDLVTTSLRQNPPPRVDRARSCLRLTAAEQTDEPLSSDHSEWEARRMRGRERKPKREELCDEDEFRTDRADSESIRCPGHSGGTSGDAATRTVIRWSHLLPRQRGPQYRGTRRGGAERPPAGRGGESRQFGR